MPFSHLKYLIQIIWRESRRFWLLGACWLLAGCVSSGVLSAQDTARVAADSPVLVRKEQTPCTSTELVKLWLGRNSNAPADFPVGPGDVITISVSEVEELQKQEVRVAPDGTIGLPLIGTMEVTGMTENELKAAISQRLGVYMKFPRLELFVERYQARDVAVMGAVHKPGLYSLANSDESIMDVIGVAGGMTTDAAQKIIFVPPKYGHGFSSNHSAPTDAGSEPSVRVAGINTAAFAMAPQNQSRDSQIISPSPYLKPSLRTGPQGLSQTDMNGRTWIVLDLAKPGIQACLDFPTRPGDVVMVPIAGQVMVQGWVRNPGAFRITPGMTILGAVSAAGGATFSWSAELLRTDSDGKQTVTEFSLSKLAKGEGLDVPVQSADVVVVEASAVGAVPYTLFQLFQHFGTGMAVPIP